MRMNDEELNAKLLLVINLYPRSVFLPGSIEADIEDGSFCRFSIINKVALKQGSAKLQIIFIKDGEQLFGHYIRFFGLHNRPWSLLRVINGSLTNASLYLSPDTKEAAIISENDSILLRLQRRGVNYYLTHFSMLSESNMSTHMVFVKEVLACFRLPSKINSRSDYGKAARKLVAKFEAAKRSA